MAQLSLSTVMQITLTLVHIYRTEVEVEVGGEGHHHSHKPMFVQGKNHLHAESYQHTWSDLDWRGSRGCT